MAEKKMTKGSFMAKMMAKHEKGEKEMSPKKSTKKDKKGY